jgi:hypothetical protein
VRPIYAEWERGEFNPRPNWANPGIEFEVPDDLTPCSHGGAPEGSRLVFQLI